MDVSTSVFRVVGIALPAMVTRTLYQQAVVSIPGLFLILFCVLINIPATAYSAQCVVSASTLSMAKHSYSSQCSLKRKDCDLVRGVWYCSSSRINSKTIQNEVIGKTQKQVSDLDKTPHEPLASVSQSQRKTSSDSICVDTDGDGWGWDGVGSCRPDPVVSSSKSSATSSSTQKRPVSLPAAVSTSQDCEDPDGDGWGWNGTSSCKMVDSVVDSDVFAAEIKPQYYRQSRSSVPDNCQKLNSGDYHITELVTDLFVTAGQSNATGDQTRYEPERFSADRVNERVIVWTENNRWEVANPRRQIWHSGKFPGGYRKFNHPAFQIGRAIADMDDCRVVAFVATAASGMPIDHWRMNQDNHFSHITATVTQAINALPVKHQVDMIWWMQGEADNDQIVNRYYNKLTDLIGKFRNESWFAQDGYFLANETGWYAYANEAIRMLGNDGSVYTDYSPGEDSLFYSFPSRPSEVDRKIHFNEVSLRKIGDLVAEKYLEEYLPLTTR